MDTAQMLGWRVAHFRPMFDAKHKRWRTPASRDGVGFPDLVLVRDRVIVAELKSGDGRVSSQQRAWLEWFAAAGIEAYVWRDDDYDAVVATLRRRGDDRWRAAQPEPLLCVRCGGVRPHLGSPVCGSCTLETRA